MASWNRSDEIPSIWVSDAGDCILAIEPLNGLSHIAKRTSQLIGWAVSDKATGQVLSCGIVDTYSTEALKEASRAAVAAYKALESKDDQDT